MGVPPPPPTRFLFLARDDTVVFSAIDTRSGVVYLFCRFCFGNTAGDFRRGEEGRLFWGEGPLGLLNGVRGCWPGVEDARVDDRSGVHPGFVRGLMGTTASPALSLGTETADWRVSLTRASVASRDPLREEALLVLRASAIDSNRCTNAYNVPSPSRNFGSWSPRSSKNSSSDRWACNSCNSFVKLSL